MRVPIIALLLSFTVLHAARAAFVLHAKNSRQVNVSGITRPDTASTHRMLMSHSEMRAWASHRWWYQKRGLGTIAAVSGLLGIVAAVGFFVVLPVSVPWAVVLAVATTVLGGVAFGVGEMSMVSAHPHPKMSITGMITGIIELIPAYIPLSAAYLVYDLIRIGTHHKKER